MVATVRQRMLTVSGHVLRPNLDCCHHRSRLNLNVVNGYRFVVVDDGVVVAVVAALDVVDDDDDVAADVANCYH